MGNKTKVIPSKAREILESVTNEFGIEVIRNYVKNYNSRKRKGEKKHNTKEEVAKDVYNLMFNKGYSKARAKEAIALKRNLSENTINNHLYNFDKEAKKNNFYTYGWIMDNIYSYYRGSFELYDTVDNLSRLNNIERDVLLIYLWKYNTLQKKERKKYQINLDNIILSNEVVEILPYESLPNKYKELQNTRQNNPQIDDGDIPF